MFNNTSSDALQRALDERRQIDEVYVVDANRVIILISTGMCSLVAPDARAASLDVFVGYADNLRPSGFFPTPWLGDPNIVSQSPAAQTFDSGAIRVDNNTGGSVTITNFEVFFPNIAFTYTLWNPLTLLPGQSGIFAQNNGSMILSSIPATLESSAFPPSNLEPNNAAGNGNTNLIGGCSSPASFMTPGQLAACNAAIPVISFLANGTPMSFSDTGHILDTGGWDFVNNGAFGEDGNESDQLERGRFDTTRGRRSTRAGDLRPAGCGTADIVVLSPAPRAKSVTHPGNGRGEGLRPSWVVPESSAGYGWGRSDPPLVCAGPPGPAVPAYCGFQQADGGVGCRPGGYRTKSPYRPVEDLVMSSSGPASVAFRIASSDKIGHIGITRPRWLLPDSPRGPWTMNGAFMRGRTLVLLEMLLLVPLLAQPLPKPTLTYQGSTDNGSRFTQFNFAVANYRDFSDELFQAAPDRLPADSTTLHRERGWRSSTMPDSASTVSVR